MWPDRCFGASTLTTMQQPLAADMRPDETTPSAIGGASDHEFEECYEQHEFTSISVMELQVSDNA